MGRIHRLDKNIYELIAAGEVVERPASVVKELVENSIDAKSTSISVNIRNGGKKLIRVVDNGMGMDESDCKLAFLRHCTSKVETALDLENITTLGFRGEALASICAVSRVEVLAKRRGDQFGTRYLIEAGEEKGLERVSCLDGAMFSIEQLFYNVPARLKFLKKDSTEANLIGDILEKLVISNPNISFEFKRDGKKIFQTSGNGSIGDVIYNIFGRDIYKTLIPVKYDDGDIKIKGFVSNPRHCRHNRSLQLSFVNGRYVKAGTCVSGIEEAFKGFAMVGKFPAFVLFLDIPSKNLDINVHPAKVEIRFSNELEVLRAVYSAAKAAISENNKLPEAKILDLKRSYFADNGGFKPSQLKIKAKTEAKNDAKKVNVFSDKLFSQTKPYKIDKVENFSEYKFLSGANIYKNKDKNQTEYKKNDAINNFSNAEESCKTEKGNSTNSNFKNQSDVFSEDSQNYLRVVGEIFKTYILAEVGDNFVIIDKHAAHERILYEKIKKESNNLERQVLIVPKKVILSSNEDHELVVDNSELFLKFGFGVEDFGGHAVLIREIPAVLDAKNFVEIFYEMVYNLKTRINDLTPETLDNMYHTMACRAAIKANDQNSTNELEALANRVYFDENIRTCPHGRPAILTFKKERFDREFGRIQR